MVVPVRALEAEDEDDEDNDSSILSDRVTLSLSFTTVLSEGCCEEKKEEVEAVEGAT
jgi:hypothetical protein